ncbi:nucleotide exchange factor SIL1 [Copidosoma floridanum]|uniref:nucleotide exchange factor SIL1 n=1 Tax=Copidosoma floridanum TaxID=29053 RepID=UPI0006C9B9D2|nr:nucleotide exchange factor SIL1 [Copidosoma floridanum]XP_014212025.1 nucleotide exchange factor SIL1 [Copidosoma floridanum]
MTYWHFTLSYLAICSFAIATDTKINDTVFIPTKEWQIVPKGTPIPPGLHIRHNLQSGVVEAKLLDENEKDASSKNIHRDGKKNSLTLHPEKSVRDEDVQEATKDAQSEKTKVPLDELKAMLKKIKSDEADELIQTANEQVHSAVQKEYRSYSELKEQLESLSMNISTDAEVLTSLFEQFQPYKETITSENLETEKIDDILGILNDMEYLLHQIDNARLFADMGGMMKVVSPSLNSTNTDIKAEALRLLGTAVQSNPKVQLKALENDFVQKILYMLTINNSKATIKSRCLFALGALIRQFPAAQKSFVNNGGFEIFGEILMDGNSQVQIRVMNLVNDLAIERKEKLHAIRDEQQRIHRTNDYDLIDFENNIVKQKYCENLVDLALRSLRVKSGIDDFHKVIYDSMLTLSELCKEELALKKKDLLTEIQKMLVLYHDFPVKGEDGTNLSYHNQEMLQKVQKVLLGEELHDEL